MRASGICAIISNDNSLAALREHPFEIANALKDAGIYTIEIGKRDPAIIEYLEKLAPDLQKAGISWGLGTCFTVEQATQAVKVGASFIVSPFYSVEIGKYCVGNNILYIPAVETVTEIVTAYRAGFSVLKIFPDPGPQYLSAVWGAIKYDCPNALFIISGIDNLDVEYLRSWHEAGAASLVHGSALFKKDILAAKDWKELTKAAKKLRKDTLLMLK